MTGHGYTPGAVVLLEWLRLWQSCSSRRSLYESHYVTIGVRPGGNSLRFFSATLLWRCSYSPHFLMMDGPASPSLACNQQGVFQGSLAARVQQRQQPPLPETEGAT